MRGQYIRTSTTDFWSLVNKDGPIPPHRPELGRCWVWQGTRHSEGYGLFGGRFAHRVSYRLAHDCDALPCCLHHCDNRACVRPAHLFAGTKADNAQDMWQKGRGSQPPHARGDLHPARRHPERMRRGSTSPQARITEADVAAIITACNAGERQADIGHRYGLTQAAISRIYRRNNWQHVAEVPASKPSKKGKVTIGMVRDIRARLAAGAVQRHLALEYGLEPSTISNIATGKTWREA